MGTGSRNIVVVGSSTGGTRILETVFADMPRLKAAVVMVHQMVSAMSPLLQQRLQARTKMDVVVAENLASLEHGKLYVAPNDVHLKIIGNSGLQLFEGEPRNGVCPSVDVVMESLRASNEAKIVGVILTGAGEDGAAGILHIKDIGGITIVQDAKTSPVATMPKAAIATGKVDSVLDPEGIRKKLIDMFGRVPVDRKERSSVRAA